MPFNEQLPKWDAPGVEPPESKKTEGYQPSEKPPADWFNWIFNRIYKVVQEIRDTVYQKTDVDNTFAPKNSPALTGTPTAPTAAADTSTTLLATTAFVVGQAATVAPVMDGVAAVGVSKKYARADHKHPTDTTLWGDNTLSTRSHVEARRTTVQSIAASTFTTVLFDVQDIDQLDEYNPATGIFTVAAAGIYLIDANVAYEGGTIPNTCIILSNIVAGGQTHAVSKIPQSTLHSVLHNSLNVKLAAGNIIYVHVYHNDTVARNLAAGTQYCYLKITRIA